MSQSTPGPNSLRVDFKLQERAHGAGLPFQDLLPVELIAHRRRPAGTLGRACWRQHPGMPTPRTGATARGAHTLREAYSRRGKRGGERETRFVIGSLPGVVPLSQAEGRPGPGGEIGRAHV